MHGLLKVQYKKNENSTFFKIVRKYQQIIGLRRPIFRHLLQS